MTLPRLLFVTHRVPYPPDKGDRIRTFHLLKFLAQHARISLISLADEPVTQSTLNVLQLYCDRVHFQPLSAKRWLRGVASLLSGGSISAGVFHDPALRQIIQQWNRESPYDIAVASASSVAEYLRLPELQNASRIVDFVDVDSQKWYDYASRAWPPRQWLYLVEGHRLRRLEQTIADWATVTTLVSEAEAALLRTFCKNGQIEAIQNGVDLDYFQPVARTELENSCVFVGALDYRPNVDAAIWFCRAIWPTLREHRPTATLRFVGRQPTGSVLELGKIPGVEVVGQVPDVRPYLAEAAVVIAPLRIARGLQNKVLEAMAMSKAVVASQAALAGFASETDIPAIQATLPADWIATIEQLWDDPQSRRERGQAGQDYAKSYHNWSTCLEPFAEWIGSEKPVGVGR